MGPNTEAERRSTSDEMDLIARIIAGDSGLFHQLVRPYKHAAYLIAFSMFLHPARAEEVVQEAFIRAYRDLRKFHGDSLFVNWLFRLLVDHAKSRKQQEKQYVHSAMPEWMVRKLPLADVIPCQLNRSRICKSPRSPHPSGTDLFPGVIAHRREVIGLRSVDDRFSFAQRYLDTSSCCRRGHATSRSSSAHLAARASTCHHSQSRDGRFTADGGRCRPPAEREQGLGLGSLLAEEPETSRHTHERWSTPVPRQRYRDIHQ